MKKILMQTGILVLILALALSGCASQSGEEAVEESTFDMEPTVWTFVDYTMPATSDYARGAAMAEAIYDRTDGLLDIQQHTLSEFPFGINDMLTVTSNRTVELVNTSFSYFEGESPITSIVNWPMMCSSIEEMDIALEALKPWLDKEFDSKNVELVSQWSIIGLGIHGRGDAPKSLNDLDGMKVRLYDKAIADVLIQYGVVPVTMSVAEVIPSMQRNVIDGAMTGAINANDNSWYDIVDWSYMINIAGACQGVFVNNDAMNELPPEVQEIVREEMANYHEKSKEDIQNAVDNATKNMEANGVEINSATEQDYKEAVAIAHELWIARAKEIGPECEEALAAVREALGK